MSTVSLNPLTSESVSEGHPDKVCDYIADSVLDACLAEDPESRVACEVLCKDGRVVVAGEVTTRATLDAVAVARAAIREVGYTDPTEPFHADGVEVHVWLSQQAPEIAHGVGPARAGPDEQGAGDQGLMFGYATDETPELLPLPLLLAHRITAALAAHRKAGTVSWLRPDAKAQVTVEYYGIDPVRVSTVVVSTQHAPSVGLEELRAHIVSRLLPETLGRWYTPEIQVLVNPAGSFVQGGPSADCGVTGRKIIVDTYGGAARHGGGAFSGKDPSKVDRSAAYFARFVARQVVTAGLARRAEVQVAYAIGVARPVSIRVDTFGTGEQHAAAEYVRERFDFRPAAIIERLGLLRPLYRKTTNYGHFGRPGLPWEEGSLVN